MHPDILWQKWNKSHSTAELPFPGPWPVNTSSLAAAWPAVEQALNESCWSWSVRNPKLEPKGPCQILPAHHTFSWFDFCRSHGGTAQENSVCRHKFADYYLPIFLMSGKPVQENNLLLRRRAPEMIFHSSAKAFPLAGVCLWYLQSKYGKQNLKITLIRNWFLKQVMYVSWQSSNEFSQLSFSNPVIH